MAGEKDTALFFFATDWMSSADVQSMTWEQRGMYHWLLCIGWLDEGIPADLKTLQGILGLSKRQFDRVWPAISRCWIPNEDGTRLVNRRQEEERVVRNRLKALRAEAGRRGGCSSNGEANEKQERSKRGSKR